MKARKYWYLKVLQANFGYGWDDLHTYDIHDKDDMQFLKRDLKDYRENQQDASFRVVNRRKAKPQMN